jgi:hypothetical protein
MMGFEPPYDRVELSNIRGSKTKPNLPATNDAVRTLPFFMAPS